MPAGILRQRLGGLRQRDIERLIFVGATLVCALFVAQGVGLMVASALLGPSDDENEESFGRPGAAAGFGRAVLGGAMGGGAGASETRDPTAILRRNIFDSETGPLDGSQTSPETSDGEDAAPIDPNAPAPSCSGGLKLVAALVNYRQPEASIAAIQSGDKAMPYQVGMQVDGQELVAVHPEYALLRNGGRACAVSMFKDGIAAPAVPPPSAPAAPKPAPAAASGGISDDDYNSGIKKISDTKYHVSRGLMNKILGNRAALLQTARITPHEEDGRVVGVRLVRIRPGTILSRIGLNTGDVLRTINGYDMASPDSALEAYARLRSADRLALSVLRNGSPTTLEYEIR